MSICVHFPATPRVLEGRSPFELRGNSTNFKDNLRERGPRGLIPFSRGGREVSRGDANVFAKIELSTEFSYKKGESFQLFQSLEIVPFSSSSSSSPYSLIIPPRIKGRDRRG